MTNLDVLCKVLNQVTGKPEQRFRQTIRAGIKAGAIPPSKLLNECPDGADLVRHLVANEAPGILNWLVKGAVIGHRQRVENAEKAKFKANRAQVAS